MEDLITQIVPHSRCTLCRTFTLLKVVGGTQYEHHPTLTALETSANNGCDLCGLFWHCIEKDCNEADISTARKWDSQQVVISANSTNMQFAPALNKYPAFDELSVYIGEEELGKSIWTKIDLFTSRHSTASEYFMGRNLTLDPSSPDNFHDIKSWIEACSKHHSCLSSSETPLPLRLLDVGSRNSTSSMLSITGGEMGIYVCLSYCWGLSPGLATTYDSLNTRMSGIRDSNLPATLRDAVYITRELGFRYLWIDALCILQRRPEIVTDQEAISDWQDQSSKMADIYGNAFLTIIAEDASDKQDGCFISRTPDPRICKISVDEKNTYELLARPYEIKWITSKTPIETRAWTFQEEALSKRRLIFGKEIRYECATCTFRERRKNPSVGSGLDIIWNPRSLMFSLPVKKKIPFVHGNRSQDLSTWKPVETMETMRDHTILQWYLNLESNFCGRSLTNETDILPALSGVARRVQTIIGGAYYAGIWEVNLPQGLLWKPRNMIPSGKGKWLSHSTVYRAPSWSWASLKGQIFYGIYSRQLKAWEIEKAESPCQILEVRTELVGPVYDPMGQVSGGWITLYAPMKAAILKKHSVAVLEHEAESKKKINEHFLVDAKLLDHSNPQAVGALGHFDTLDAMGLDFCCILLSKREGLMIRRVEGGSAAFKRVGIFRLQRSGWFEGCETECLTIV